MDNYIYYNVYHFHLTIYAFNSLVIQLLSNYIRNFIFHQINYVLDVYTPIIHSWL